MQADPTPPPHQDALFEIQARFARTMGHPMRLRILHELSQAEGEVPTARLIRILDIPKAALSQHLSKMVSVGLVKTRREGRYLHLQIADREIGKACEMVRCVLSKQARERDSILNPSSVKGVA